MLKRLFPIATLLVSIYLFFWPVAVEPVAWQPEKDLGLIGDFAANNGLKNLRYISFSPAHGAEDLAVNSKGEIFTGTHDGWIHRLTKDHSGEWLAEQWLNTGGRPLGLEFDAADNLLVADALVGLVRITPDKEQTILLAEIDGKTIGFLDDLDILSDGRIIFSDASSKFPARDFGGTVDASRYDINEHGGHGAVYLFDPSSGEVNLLADQLEFANGIAISQDENWVLVNETGRYRVLKIGIALDNFAEQQTVIDNLPGFPDNIARATDGSFWVGLVSPRNKLLDLTAPYPLVRKVSQRLPQFLQPQPERYGHLINISAQGQVLLSLQETSKEFGFITGAVDVDGELILSSLLETSIGVMPLSDL